MKAWFCRLRSVTLSGWLFSVLFGFLWLACPFAVHADESADTADGLRVLFLGDNGPHVPAERAAELIPAMAERGIAVEYTDEMADALTAERLGEFDGLIVYANIDTIEASQADALLEYVRGGGGFIPLHCASFCFRNDPRVVALIGGQFSRHDSGVFSVEPTEAGRSHPLMQGYRSFESWDETYTHTKHNRDGRTVLEVRAEGDRREPWTWVRTEGAGRVFYTAWGHDSRTFTHPGFQNLVERGVRWACGGDPATVPAWEPESPDPLEDVRMAPRPSDLPSFEYVDVGPKIPNYVSGEKWGTQTEPVGRMQKPLSPEASRERFVVPEDFVVELVVSEPELGGKPICMSWDHRGRLWVAETVDYPNEKRPEGEGRDRIRICEDTTGDGRADRFTLFAENLSIPTSIAFSHGGVIVHQPPHTLFLRDTDGDDRADERKVLFSGWKTDDTHAGPSNLQDGFDGWFYGVVGYAGFEGEIAGERRSFRTGFYRFRVDRVGDEVEVTDFEFLRNTDNNTWGLGISEEGLLFGSTANRNPSEFMPLANRFYERVRGWTSTRLEGIADTHLFEPITDRVRQVDHHGGYTAAAGHALYTARNYPPEYWNRTAFVAGPTGHLVGTFALRSDGSGFRSTSPLNLIASDDEWSAPTMAEVGPDGHVWVIDWYNYIVQHNPTPAGFETGAGNAYVTDLRDKTHARIYRVRYDGERGGPTPRTRSLEGATESELVDALRDPNLFWRRHAQRLLVESDATGVAERLAGWVREANLDESGSDVGAIHALRMLDLLGRLDEATLRAGLAHRSPGVVRVAVEVLPRTADGLVWLLESGVIGHDDAQVRLASMKALAEMPGDAEMPGSDGDSEGAGVAEAVVTAVTDPRHRSDRWILDAATSAAATHAPESLVALLDRSPETPAAGRIARVVAEHLARNGDGEGSEKVIVAAADASPRLAAAVVEGLIAGWPSDGEHTVERSTDAAMAELLTRLPGVSRGPLVRLARRWGSEELAKQADAIAESLLATVRDVEAAEGSRVEAAEQYLELVGDTIAAVDVLLESITPQMSPEVASGVVEAVRRSRAEGVGERVIAKFAALTPAVRPAAIRVLASRPETTRALLDAIASGEIARDELTLDQQQALLSHPNREIRRQAERVMAEEGGVPSGDRVEVVASMMPAIEMTGDVERGRKLFEKNCANCHRYGELGKEVGPDLTGMAVHPKEELLTHILDPSRSVEGNYRSYSVLTADGIVITGMLASETRTSIELIDSQAKRHRILREEIDELIASDKSVMPEGFEKQIELQGFADLLSFMTRKGRFVPLPIGKVATAVSTRGLFHEGDSGPDRLVLEDWSPKVSGGVPFRLVDPREGRVPNLILLNGPLGTLPPTMPRSVRVPCNTDAKSIHLLSGMSGWGFPAQREESVSMIVRLHHADGTSEDHRLRNGVHFADYIRRVDVPGSEFAFAARGQQVRQLSIRPRREGVIESIEFVKGDDSTAPMVLAVTAERDAP